MSVPQYFTEELTAIGGTNDHGQPILRCVWGATIEVWEAGGWCLKYSIRGPEVLIGFEYVVDGVLRFVEKLGDVPLTTLAAPVYRAEEKGEERWIIERWRSPEFLATTGRFQVRHDPETGEELIPELPAEGHYDFFMRLQNTDGTPHAPDREALEMVRALWGYEHNYTLGERNQFALDQLRDEQKREVKLRREAANAAWGFATEDFTVVTGSDGHSKVIRKAREI